MDRRVFILDNKLIKRKIDSIFNININNSNNNDMNNHRNFYKIHHLSININPISYYINNIFILFIILE
jgi:hypothetical protein